MRNKKSYFQDVAAFHKKFGIDYKGPPRNLPRDLKKFRWDRLTEEFNECWDAWQSPDPVGELDGLVDLVYIALGTAHLHGWDFDEAWRRVHRANMRKIRAKKKGMSRYGMTCDVVKPKGWKPPNLKDLV